MKYIYTLSFNLIIDNFFKDFQKRFIKNYFLFLDFEKTMISPSLFIPVNFVTMYLRVYIPIHLW
jgi:hypothetical protein